MAGIEIKEGFLCPMCMQDLGTVAQLTAHFEEQHSSEDKDVINQLKGLFDKAKKKILKKEREDEVGAVPYVQDKPVTAAARVSGTDPTLWEPQTLGSHRSHTDLFKRVRDTRIDRFVIETNKLLIRLDKLISPDVPSDPGKRKDKIPLLGKALDKVQALTSGPSGVGKVAKGVLFQQVTQYDEKNNPYEKTVVPWAHDSEVPFCATCGKRFNLSRRRHHCRLCGGIMCNSCSQFLPLDYAKKLTNPSYHYEGDGFRRSNSNSSLNSLFTPEGEMQTRTCGECRTLLERRDQQMEQRNSKPMLVQLYEKMKGYISETDRLLPYFLKMTDALNNGETTYSLEDAQMLRMKVMKLYESIDSISKRILNLGLDNTEPSSPKQLQLQRMVRVYANGYLQDNLMGLQSLPTAEQYEVIKERKKEEIQRKIEMERQAAIERARQREQKDQKDPTPQTDAGSAEKTHRRQGSRGFVQDQGWKPAEAMPGSSEDDPMVQQMNIIKGYIKQAKLADRWDEAQMLEENLKDLQREYWRQQQQTEAEDARKRLQDQSEAATYVAKYSGQNEGRRDSGQQLQQQEQVKRTNVTEQSSQSNNTHSQTPTSTTKQASPKKSLNPFEDDYEEPKRSNNVQKRSMNPFDNI